ncbi:MAG TPA: tetratricopeptide repeat protein [Bryobacteraceae bacterium]|nr:tetratricopeptide repeat protein [Bryobacteraceae bacterium]
MSEISGRAIRAQVKRIMSSEGFSRSPRLSRFLGFTVEQTLASQGERLKEYVLGIEVFDKEESFDPRIDTIVRVEARRLRLTLLEYYATRGQDDPVRIDFPKGSYVPTFYTQGSRAAHGEPREISSVAALPFVNMSADPADEYFSDGLTEELIHALAGVEGLRVAARTSAFQFRGKSHDIRKIGRQLRVGTVLEGSVRKDGDRLRVTAQLNNTNDGCHLWSETYDRAMTQVFAIQQEIAQAIVNTLRIKAAQKRDRQLVSYHTQNVEAHDLYLRGRYFWNKRGAHEIQKSIEYFGGAIEKDPRYALAYTGLADAYASLGFSFDAGILSPTEAVPKAKAAISKALQLNDGLAEAHLSLAFVRFLYDWDWAGAESEFCRAIELDPLYAHAHHWYSHYLLAMGRVEESLEESWRAIEIEPLDAILNTHLGWHHLYSNQHDLAIEQLRRALEVHPGYFHSRREIGRAYTQKGMYRQAIASLHKALRQSKEDGFTLASLGYAYAAAGRRDDARRVLDEIRGLSGRRYISPYFAAAIHAGLGEPDLAFAHLDEAWRERADALVYLTTEPMFDSLHSDSRFTSLMKRMGLSVARAAAASPFHR